MFTLKKRGQPMKSILILIFLCTILSIASFAQSSVKEDIETAYQNAKKGIYWALDNIPDKKVKLENDLIVDNKLYAKVKIEKEVEGIKFQSTGYYHSNEVTIIIYRSNSSLVKDGYLKE